MWLYCEGSKRYESNENMQTMTLLILKWLKKNLIEMMSTNMKKMQRNAICKDVTNPHPPDLEESQNYCQYSSNLKGEQT